MKIRTLGIAALVLSLCFAVSCQEEDIAWKDIPYETVEAASDNATITVNGVEAKYGKVQLNAVSGTEAKLLLDEIVPGYGSITAQVELEKISDTSFDFSGETSLDHPFVSLSRAESTPEIYALSVSGNVTTEGKITVRAETKVIDAKLAGTWSIRRNSTIGASGLPLAGPLEFEVPGQSENATLANIVASVNMVGGMLVADVLNKVTFLENGNITAEFHSPFKLGIYFPDIDNETGAVYYKASTHDNEWMTSPAANYAFWYTDGDYFFVVPEMSEISSGSGSDSGSGSGSGISISDIVGLADYGVDVVTLLAKAAEIVYTGAPLHYTLSGDSLDLYLEKTDLEVIMQCIFADPDKLDVLVEALRQSDYGPYIDAAFGVLNISKASDILTLWNSLPTFKLILHLTK